MNLQNVCDLLSQKGFRKGVSARPTDEGLKVIDYNPRGKRTDMFSVYVNSLGSVEYVEYTKLKWDNQTRRYVPVVTKYNCMADLIKLAR